MLLQVTAAAFTSPYCGYTSKNSITNSSTLLPLLGSRFYVRCQSQNATCFANINATRPIAPLATLIEAPILWAGRICIFYALPKAGLAGSPDNPLVSEKEAANRRKLVSKWHPTTKGTLRRNYRVPSKSEGKRLLRAVASLLSDDDQFRDATSHTRDVNEEGKCSWRKRLF